MRTVVIHDGPIEHALALTSLIEGLHRQHGIHTVDWVTSPQKAIFFKHIPKVVVHEFQKFAPVDEYDLCINYGGSSLAVLTLDKIRSEDLYGVASTDTVVMEEAYEVLYEGKETKQNIFQVLYQFADLTWRGEGYAFHYYPRARMKNDYVGIAVRNDMVRAYLKQNLEVVERRLWHVPIKEDPLKQFDEVNRVESLITDDPFVMQVGIALRKHVELLTYETPKIRPEFFGNGFSHLVPQEIAGPISLLS